MAPLKDVVESLLFRYASVIDDGDLSDWPGFFAEDGEYRLIPRENFIRGLPAALIFCKNRAMMRDRVIAIKKASVYSPQRYRHYYSNLLIERSGTHVTLRANYLVCRTQDEGDTIVFSTGRLIAALSVPEETSIFSIPPPSSRQSLDPKADPNSTDAPWTIRSAGIEAAMANVPSISAPASRSSAPGLSSPPSIPSVPGVPRLPTIVPSLPPPSIMPSLAPQSSGDAGLSIPPPSRRRPTATPVFLSMAVIYDTCRIPGLLVFPI
jgi:anthranilate 1,2-dioxygenase small subunit